MAAADGSSSHGGAEASAVEVFAAPSPEASPMLASTAPPLAAAVEGFFDHGPLDGHSLTPTLSPEGGPPTALARAEQRLGTGGLRERMMWRRYGGVAEVAE